MVSNSIGVKRAMVYSYVLRQGIPMSCNHTAKKPKTCDNWDAGIDSTIKKAAYDAAPRHIFPPRTSDWVFATMSYPLVREPARGGNPATVVCDV